ncbi:hypothetical protein K2X96_02205 [Patescibacteria group bacterium]|nr:hypothetical protein [Patescibacteria group bacterium]
MENEILERLKAQEAKIEAIYESVEKTRKYFLVVMWVTVALVVLPAIGLVFALPAFLSSYTASLEGLI